MPLGFVNDLKKKRNSEALHATTDIFHQPESCAKCFFSLTKGQSAHSLRPQLAISLLCQSSESYRPWTKSTLEASGCEHIQVTGFEIMGSKWLFLSFYHWDIHLWRLKGCWIFTYSCGLGMHHLHRRGFGGTFVNLNSKTRIRFLQGSWSKEAPFVC